jgi:hypothetical protein
MTIFRVLLVTAVLSSLALAQNLVNLAPQGAIAGFYMNDLSKNPYLKGLAADWKNSGLEALLKKELGSDADMLGLAQGGMVAAFYPSGFFVLLRPSPVAMKAIKADTKGLKAQGGWMVSKEKDMTTAFSKDLALIASPAHANLFFANKRGLQAPIKGDIAMWGAVPQNMVKALELPARTTTLIKGINKFSLSLTLTAGGYTSETRLEVNPKADPQFGGLVLPKDKPWDLADFPAGYAGSSVVLDLASTARLLSSLLADFDLKLKLDLSAFGSRIVSVTPAIPVDPKKLDALDNPLGHALYFIEVKDQATAEANLLALLQSVAAFATPEGQGGFKVVGEEAGFKVVETGMLGKLYYRFDGGKLVLATSTDSVGAVSGKQWRDDAGFSKFRVRIPANASGYTYSNQAGALEGAVGQLRQTLPQAIGAEPGDKEAKELNDKMLDFFERVFKRFGSSLDYSVVEGNSVVNRGFAEVKW